MPRYVRVVAFRAQGVEYLEDRDLVERFFQRADDHTDETLSEQLHALLASMPKVTVLGLTEPEDQHDSMCLHVVTATERRMHPLDRRQVERRADAGAGGDDAMGLAVWTLRARDPFPGALKSRGDLAARLVHSEAAVREPALLAARKLASSLARDDETRARKKQLVSDVIAALGQVTDRAHRERLWDVASWLPSPEIRAVTLDALRTGDAALSDDHVERQRKLVLEELPRFVGAGLREAPDAPWVARARSILSRWSLAPIQD